jgi:dCTP deaminase
MILSDRDIKQFMKDGKIIIRPLDEPDVQIQPSGVDLKLGNEFRIFKISSTPYIDPKAPPGNYTEIIRVEDDKQFILHPGEFVLGVTKEYIKVPDELMGVMDGRSSLGRLGIVVHTTSAGINPGWEGILTLEITNVGKMPVALYPGMRICKIAFHKLTSLPERSYSAREGTKYQNQKGAEESRISDEFLK